MLVLLYPLQGKSSQRGPHLKCFSNPDWSLPPQAFALAASSVFISIYLCNHFQVVARDARSGSRALRMWVENQGLFPSFTIKTMLIRVYNEWESGQTELYQFLSFSASRPQKRDLDLTPLSYLHSLLCHLYVLPGVSGWGEEKGKLRVVISKEWRKQISWTWKPWRFLEGLSQSAWAAVTRSPDWVAYKQRNVSHGSGDQEVQDQVTFRFGACWGLTFCFIGSTFFVSSGCKGWASSLGPHWTGAASPFMTHSPLKVRTPSHCHPWRVRISTYEFVGYTNIQIIAVSFKSYHGWCMLAVTFLKKWCLR